MISFRHHIVTLTAVFLALAVGVVLGGGPLSEVGRTGEQEVRAAQQKAVAAQREAQVTAGFEDEFASAAATRILANGLADRGVVLLTMPGADAETVSALTAMVGKAGGSVTGTYALQTALVDPSERSLVDTLGSQLAESEDLGTVADATTYPRMGFLLGRAVATTAGVVDVDGKATSIIESLKGAELVRASGDVTGRGALVLVALGDDPAADSGVGAAVGGLVTGLRSATAGVVVTGATESSLLAELRENSAMTAKVTTTDSVQTGAGRVGAVLGLISAASGSVGSYGAAGSDGPVSLR